jgi:hypothetical protein
MGTPQLGLKARHDTKANSAQNRWCSTLSWSHRMIHESSRAGTRTKRKLSSLAFQPNKECLVSLSYEGDVANFIKDGLLNLNRTRSPSWRRLVAWWWGRCWCSLTTISRRQLYQKIMRICISYTHLYPNKPLNHTSRLQICKMCFWANMQIASTLWPPHCDTSGVSTLQYNHCTPFKLKRKMGEINSKRRVK